MTLRDATPQRGMSLGYRQRHSGHLSTSTATDRNRARIQQAHPAQSSSANAWTTLSYSANRACAVTCLVSCKVSWTTIIEAGRTWDWRRTHRSRARLNRRTGSRDYDTKSRRTPSSVRAPRRLKASSARCHPNRPESLRRFIDRHRGRGHDAFG